MCWRMMLEWNNELFACSGGFAFYPPHEKKGVLRRKGKSNISFKDLYNFTLSFLRPQKDKYNHAINNIKDLKRVHLFSN